jgi:hypothetical protein
VDWQQLGNEHDLRDVHGNATRRRRRGPLPRGHGLESAAGA